MSDEANIRRERIERLLRELEYEVTRGVMEREIDPEMGWSRIMPGGPTGQVVAEFRVRPLAKGQWEFEDRRPPRLRVVSRDAEFRDDPA